jgi:hypothetical protein
MDNGGNQEQNSMVNRGDNSNALVRAAEPQRADYENIFGPAGRDVKMDAMRNKRISRVHLPDALRGSNPWMADRIDGLITDATNSPFTSIILPYKYIEQVRFNSIDMRSCNVFSFFLF